LRLNKAFFEKNKEYFNFYGVIILIASIMFFGPMFSKWYGANFINKVKLYSNIPFEIDLNRSECQAYFCNSKNKLNIKESDYAFFIEKIANELINNDTQVINGDVPIEIQNKDDFVIRKNEVILIKNNVINKYFKAK
jgi:hypothetical protein